MALKSFLLTAEDYHFLLRSRHLDDFLGYLSTTAYGEALSGWDWQTPEAESEFSQRLYGELAQAFQKVGRGLKKRERLFIGILAQRLVAENLKVVLRTLHRGLAPDQAVRLLIPVDRLSPLNFRELLNQKDISALVNYLANTPWGPPLARGLPRYLREHSLFPLEMSIRSLGIRLHPARTEQPVRTGPASVRPTSWDPGGYQQHHLGGTLSGDLRLPRRGNLPVPPGGREPGGATPTA